MPIQREPLKLLQSKGRVHRSKLELAEREASEVHAPADKIKAPDCLTTEQKREFTKIAKQLVDLEIMSNLDCDTLARYLIAKAEYIRCSAMLAKIPFHPDVIDLRKKTSNMASNAEYQCRQNARELGLTISSRCNLVVPKADKPPVNKFERFGGGLA